MNRAHDVMPDNLISTAAIATDLIATDERDGIARLRLTNGIANTLTTDVLQALSAAVADVVAKGQPLLLCGGDRFFSNGVDIGWALGQDQAGIRTMFLELGNVLLSLLEAPVPVVGVMRGHAIGGATSVFLACDYRYAAVGRVLVGVPEMLLGLEYVGSDLLRTGKVVKAEDAVEPGLVHQVAEADEIEDLAMTQLRFLNGMTRQAFAESKNRRVGAFCADLRAQMSSRVARQVDVWNSKEAQLLLTTAAEPSS